jgi:hypothetical protein
LIPDVRILGHKLSNAGEQVLWASGGLVVSRFPVDEAEEFDLVDDFNMVALGDPIGPVRKGSRHPQRLAAR